MSRPFVMANFESSGFKVDFYFALVMYVKSVLVINIIFIVYGWYLLGFLSDFNTFKAKNHVGCSLKIPYGL